MTLLDRLRAATEGSRELDMQIARAVGYVPSWAGDGEIRFYKPGAPQGSRTTMALAYTTSLDAAITLLPLGHSWGVGYYGEGCPPATAWCTGGICLEHNAPSPALALCIAALTARGP